MAVDLNCFIIPQLFLLSGYPAAWKDRASEGNFCYSASTTINQKQKNNVCFIDLFII